MATNDCGWVLWHSPSPPKMQIICIQPADVSHRHPQGDAWQQWAGAMLAVDCNIARIEIEGVNETR